MCERRFLVSERDASGDEPEAPQGKDVFYEILNILCYRQAKKVNLIFEGCGVPDQRPIADVFELVAKSALVVD
jgi:hypothetical protein